MGDIWDIWEIYGRYMGYMGAFSCEILIQIEVSKLKIASF